MKTKSTTELSTREYQTLSEKFTNNVTLKKDEINFMVSFMRKLHCK